VRLTWMRFTVDDEVEYFEYLVLTVNEFATVLEPLSTQFYR
jgi:hypothetical protein